jgi:hypothetical protein
MTKELLSDRTPICAEPIIIDDFLPGRAQEYESDYVDYGLFVTEALGHDIHQRQASRLFSFVTATLVERFELPILPPHQQAEVDGEQWGPYDSSDYFINMALYMEQASMLEQALREQHGEGVIAELLSYVSAYVEREVGFDISLIPAEDLPGALFTTRRPVGHINEGNLVPFTVFGHAPRRVHTSASKAASTFDLVVERLGDEEARAEIAKLVWMGNPRSRSNLRNSLFINTRSMADLFEELKSQSPKESGFNALSMRVLEYVLSECEVDDPPKPEFAELEDYS